LLRKPAPQRYPKGADQLRALDWFGRSTPIVVLPSVSALRAQRQSTSGPAAPEPYLGFGDPVLVGNRACVIPEVPTACPTFSATGSAPTRNARPRAIGPSRQATRLLRNGVVDVDAVRALCPLPDTAAELRCVAASLGAPTERVLLGPAATVSAARATDLGRFRILHFATHGLVAGDIATTSGALSEPALVMTPPATAIPGDDGLLRVSDIVTLRLNADWVILSACNTAAGRGPRGEALSGLASAFLYAGARSLLVSHWPVRSDAAVQLTSRAIRAMAADPAMTRAEAMRRAMVELIDASPPDMSHPSVWAPFSVVGDARLTPP
jgi:CHAT domain-containing protein